MSVLLENKKAYFDYEVMEEMEAGLELLGREVKSLRSCQGSLSGSKIIARGGEAFLVGVNITPYQPGNISGMTSLEENNRTIRLLLTKKEINYLAGKTEERGITAIPLKIFTLGKKIKLKMAIVRGKKNFEKREKIKKRETERNLRRIMKE